MKKLVSMLLVMTMMLSLVACGSSKKATNDAPVDVLKNVWETYAEDEKFAIIGGDASNMTSGEAGACDVADAEGLDASFGFPQSSAALLEDAASLVHMMNANTFTAAAYRVANASDLEMLIPDLEDNISTKQWMCGFPETLIIVQLGDNTLVSAYGAADLVETFKTKVLEAYEGAEVVVEKSLM